MEDHGSSSARSDSAAKSQLLPSEVLSRAADLIEPEGAWLQGAFAADEAGVTTEEEPLTADAAVCFCVYGAISVASGQQPDADEPSRDLDAFLFDAIGLPKDAAPARVAEWNDAPGRTQAEVVSALRKAADLARSEGQ